MAILCGTNGSTTVTHYGKKTEKAVNTGWASAESRMESLAPSFIGCDANIHDCAVNIRKSGSPRRLNLLFICSCVSDLSI